MENSTKGSMKLVDTYTMKDDKDNFPDIFFSQDKSKTP